MFYVGNIIGEDSLEAAIADAEKRIREYDLEPNEARELVVYECHEVATVVGEASVAVKFDVTVLAASAKGKDK